MTDPRVPVRDDLSDDGRLVLDADARAILWPERCGFSLRTVPTGDPKATIPEPALAMTACFMRLECDPEFREEMAAWFVAQARAVN